MKINDDKMQIDHSRYWLECLEANLLDADYRVYTDNETSFKIAAIRRLLERNIQLENALFEAETARQALGKAIGSAL